MKIESSITIRDYLETDLLNIDNLLLDKEVNGNDEHELKKRYNDYYAISKDNVYLGEIYIKNIGKGTYDIGIYILKKYRRCHYGSIAISTLIDYYVERYGAYNFYISIDISDSDYVGFVTSLNFKYKDMINGKLVYEY